MVTLERCVSDLFSRAPSRVGLTQSQACQVELSAKLSPPCPSPAVPELSVQEEAGDVPDSFPSRLRTFPEFH